MNNKVKAFGGYSGILSMVAYVVLQRFGLLQFSPVIDQLFGVLFPVTAVSGAVVLRNLDAPTK